MRTSLKKLSLVTEGTSITACHGNYLVVPRPVFSKPENMGSHQLQVLKFGIYPNLGVSN